MKKLLFLVAIFFGLAFSFSPLHAQMLERTPYDYQQIPSRVDLDADWAKEIKMRPNIKRQMKPISAPLAKVIANPSGVMELENPLIIKKNGKCIEIISHSNHCDDCTILWKDLNGDNKIQPKKELKAVCRKTKKPCDVKVNRC